MNSSQEPPVQYESCLLRLRLTTRGGRPVCQVMLICLPEQETYYFADRGGLMDFLRRQPDHAPAIEKGDQFAK